MEYKDYQQMMSLMERMSVEVQTVLQKYHVRHEDKSKHY